MDVVDALHRRLAGCCFRGAVRVDVADSVVLRAGYGEDGGGRPLAAETAFQIASISKSFTAACAFLLAREGRFGLDDRLGEHLGGAVPAWHAITLRMLLSHTSGLPHWPDLPEIDLYRPYPREELIRAFEEVPFRFEPGRGWSYSSPGYVVLAHVLESAGGAPYGALLERTLLVPLGLGATRRAEPPAGVPQATGSIRGRAVPSFDLAAVAVGTGDLWSTVDDLVEWPRLLEHTIGEEIFSTRAHVGDDDDGVSNVGYAHGWFTGELAQHRLVYHPGDQSGFTSLVARLPDDDVTIAILAADELSLAPFVVPTLLGLLAEAG